MKHFGHVVVIVAVLATSGCGKPLDELDRMATRGEINQAAPSVADGEIIIAASPEAVWRRLTDIGHWPAWWPDVSSAKRLGPLAAGTVFAWVEGGISVRSHLRLVETEHRMAWTGRALTLKAIHVWQLDPAGHGATRVRVTESLEGLGTRWLLSSEELRESIVDSLSGLKRAAES